MANHDTSPNLTGGTGPEYYEVFRTCFSNLAELCRTRGGNFGNVWVGIIMAAPSRVDSDIVEAGVELRPFFYSRFTWATALDDSKAKSADMFGRVSFHYVDSPGTLGYTAYNHELRTDGQLWVRDPWFMDRDARFEDGTEFHPVTEVTPVRELGNMILKLRNYTSE